MYIFGNWKMHGDHRQWQALFQGITTRLSIDAAEGNLHHTYAIFPPYLALPDFCNILKHKDYSFLQLGAQTAHFKREGAYTGSISVPMLQDFNVKYILAGHSERRDLGETNHIIAEQVSSILKAGLIPVLCIGETLEEKNEGKTFSVLEQQIKEGLSLIPENTQTKEEIIIAYEPRWAIGTGLTATNEDLQNIFCYLSNLIDSPFLYGGSVKPENAESLSLIEGIDGFLIGGASLDAESFVSIGRNSAKD